MTSYWSSIVTIGLSCPGSEILEALYPRKPLFHTPSIVRLKFRGVPFAVSVLLGSVVQVQ